MAEHWYPDSIQALTLTFFTGIPEGTLLSKFGVPHQNLGSLLFLREKMNFKQTVIFAFIVTIIGFGFKDFCPNYKQLEKSRTLIEKVADGKVYEWATTKKCELSIVSIDGVSLEKYMKENSSKIKDNEEIKQLEKMFK